MALLSNAYTEEEPETSLNPGENSNRKPKGKAQWGLHLPANRCLSSTFLKKKKAFLHMLGSLLTPLFPKEGSGKNTTWEKQDPSWQKN